ncbi:patatin-like phospholipase family protein [Paenibacillus sp. CC-CFT747]|nr:patatin-like phospholipase family protein [Paenibacillus sp. CC-CFT747]
MEVGLALAGGGVPGSVSIGVIRALEEEGIRITHVGGASSGAMIAALYAYGLTPDDMTEVVPQLNRRYLDFDWKAVMMKVLFYRPYLEGWLKGKRLHDLIAKLTEDSTLSSFRIPCAVMTTDLSRGEPVLFSNSAVDGYSTETEALIAQAVQASFSIPVLFQPVRWKDYVLVDGGVLNNCPVRIVKAMGAAKVISVDPITPFVTRRTFSIPSAYAVFNQIVNLTLQGQMREEHRHSDIALYPSVGEVSAFDFGKVNHCIEIGYRYTKERMEGIIRKLQEPT